MKRVIAKKYAKALLDGDNKNLDSYIDQLDAVSEALKNPEIETAMNSPMIDNTQKTEWIIDAIKNNADSTIVRLVELMGEKKRLELIPEVADILSQEYEKIRNSYSGTVESANVLDEKQIASLENSFSQYSGATIKLKAVKSDFNGIKAEVEDLGLELNFSKDKVKDSLLDYIQKAL